MTTMSSLLTTSSRLAGSRRAATAAYRLGRLLLPQPCTTSSCSKRCYNSYTYPFATEAPEVTQTVAKDAGKKQEAPSSPAAAATSTISTSSRNSVKKMYSLEGEDPFDDAHTLSEQEHQDVLRHQRESLPTQLSSSLITGGGAITPEIPLFVPPNVPASQLLTPSTLITTLANGVRVVSQETYGQVSTVGVVAALGSRVEKNNRVGSTTNLLEMLAFGDTQKYTGREIAELLQDWGGTRFVSTGREQSLWCLDLLRPNVDKALEFLLDQVLLHPQFHEYEIEEAQQVLGFQALDLPPEILLSEAIQAAAFGSDQQLGRPHFYHDSGGSINDNGNSNNNTPVTTRDDLVSFWESQVVHNPHGLVVAGAGVSHEQLVEWSETYLGGLVQRESSMRMVESVYRGGQEHMLLHPATSANTTVAAPDDGLVRVAVAFPVGGWHSQDLVTTCVLQTLLGGGNSFSAGGPGKGMYSRLYRQVLNRYIWAESAEAFTSFYHEAGLWGISGSTIPSKARDMVQVLTSHMARLAVEPVTDEELSRARNMLKCNVLTQLESRLVLFEDLGRQVLTYGKREDIATTCQKIDQVSAQDVLELARRSIQNNPITLASVGADLKSVPQVHEVMEWIR